MYTYTYISAVLFFIFSNISVVKFCSHMVRYWDVIKLAFCENYNRK